MLSLQIVSLQCHPAALCNTATSRRLQDCLCLCNTASLLFATLPRHCLQDYPRLGNSTTPLLFTTPPLCCLQDCTHLCNTVPLLFATPPHRCLQARTRLGNTAPLFFATLPHCCLQDCTRFYGPTFLLLARSRPRFCSTAFLLLARSSSSYQCRHPAACKIALDFTK